LVERSPEKAGVGGSSPSLATMFSTTYKHLNGSGCPNVSQFRFHPSRQSTRDPNFSTARSPARLLILMKTEFLGVAPLLQVYDMPTAVHFYHDLLGFELVNQSRDGEEFDWSLLSRGGAEIMLNTMYESGRRPSQPDANRAAAHNDTVALPKRVRGSVPLPW
jgi:hypothetical protein